MYHYWEFTSIYRPLSYPFRILVLCDFVRVNDARRQNKNIKTKFKGLENEIVSVKMYYMLRSINKCNFQNKVMLCQTKVAQSKGCLTYILLYKEERHFFLKLKILITTEPMVFLFWASFIGHLMVLGYSILRNKTYNSFKLF